MKFSEVVGQRETCRRLVHQANGGRVPHAMLLCGPEGCGKFAIALAYAAYLLCSRPGSDDACGSCPSCVKARKLEHPDLHFMFPVIGGKSCSHFYRNWEAMIRRSPYFTLETWLAEMEGVNQQPTIYASETTSIMQELSLHSSEGGRKVVIVWLPEKMEEATANKMLKIFEEPPKGTVFLLVSDEPEKILPTVASRMQRIDVPPIQLADMKEALERDNALDSDEAMRIARITKGNYAEALAILQATSDADSFFEQFVALMRKAYGRDIKGLLEWSEGIAAWGRERQKSFLRYALRMVRENFMSNFHMPEVNYMNSKEAVFSRRFARFVNERNVIGLASEFDRAARDIAGNANAAIVLFDLAIKTIILIRKQ